MQLIDTLLAVDDRELWAQALVAPPNALLRDGRLPAVAALEHMAQASAAYFGWHAMCEAERDDVAVPEPAPGMLVACRSLDTRVTQFETGAQLLIAVEPAAGNAGSHALVRFRGRLWGRSGEHSPDSAAALRAYAADHEPAVSAEFSVYVPPANGTAPQGEPHG